MKGDKVLEVTDLENINYIPKESELTLKLLVDFYEQYLCKRIYVFILEDGEKVKIFFKDTSEIFHVSGIDHIYEGMPMDSKRFINEIRKNNITFEHLKNINLAAYKDYIDRIRSMYCIDTIMKNCEYLFFSENKIPDSTIKITYLLLKGLDGKNLHLGIDTYKKGKPYFLRTLLVTEKNTANKFIEKADGRIKVNKLEIRDKETDEILECIERHKAEKLVKESLENIINEWIRIDFQKLLWIYLTNEKTIIDVVKAQYEEDIAQYKEKECVGDSENLIMTKVILMNRDKYISILRGMIKRKHRDNWKKNLHDIIDNKKEVLKEQSNGLDQYWSGKLVGVCIRNVKKKDTMNKIKENIDLYIEKYVVEIITVVINENRTETNVP